MAWAINVQTLLQSIGLYEVWVNQGVGNVNVFISLLQQRVFGMCVRNWNTDINDSIRARCYSVYADFRFQPYLNLINIENIRVALSRFRVSAHRLENETGRWHKTYYWKRLNMPKIIELMKTENKIEIRNLSMFIMKSFEIRKKKLYFD